MTEVVVSPVQGTDANNGLKRRLGADMLMDEASPSPAPTINERDKVKRIRMDSAEYGMGGFGQERANWNGMENLTNSIYREFGSTEDGPAGKRARGDIGMKFDKIGSSSSSAVGANDSIFGDVNSHKLREKFYSHMERQMAATQEKLKKNEVELQGQKTLSQRLLGKLQEREDERRVLIKGVTISDNRNRELQMQVQDLQAECKHSRFEVSTAQRENNQLQVVLQGARDYILHLERQLHGQNGNQMHAGGAMGGGDNDHFMPPAPPDVF